MGDKPRVLIEDWMPIAQIGAESQRERGASSALPPLYFLHVWWARRPLTVSRAAILGSLLPAWSEDWPKGLREKFPTRDAYHQWFLKLIGIFGDPAMVRRAILRAKDEKKDLGPNPYSSRDCAPRWQEAGIGLGEAREWRKANFQPETAVAWKQAGLTARDAEGWAGFTLDAMRAWKAAGFDGTAAQALKGAKLDLDTAKTWREAGFDADATVSWRRKGFSLQAASNAKETCPKGIERLSTLVQTNPFDVEGRCFEFAAQTLQIIDRTHALYILSPELDPYYVEFTTRSAPPMGFQGFVVGVGTFSYVATSGVAKVVPHLQQLDLGK